MGIIHVNFRDRRTNETIVRVNPVGFVIAVTTLGILCASLFPVFSMVSVAFDTYINALQPK